MNQIIQSSLCYPNYMSDLVDSYDANKIVEETHKTFIQYNEDLDAVLEGTEPVLNDDKEW